MEPRALADRSGDINSVTDGYAWDTLGHTSSRSFQACDDEGRSGPRPLSTISDILHRMEFQMLSCPVRDLPLRSEDDRVHAGAIGPGIARNESSKFLS